ncbi:nucleotidyltransferase domain-containing protein [Patescibacteria group bacterium]|nr:nucleotidyltransferase domain-containing protein [Patescibacteria group bacterium]
MATLLKPGINKILNVFYRRRNENIHLRELARETKMQGQGISRYLNELEKNKILKSKKQGNLKQYSLMQNQEVYAILTMFDIEKTKKLPLLRKNAISTYLHSLPHPPVFAVIFGSTAKETYTEESDIDILIVTQTRINTKNAEKEADALNAMNISTFQITFQKFKKELKLKEDKVIQSAINTGYPVLNHIYYYEILQNERL